MQIVKEIWKKCKSKEVMLVITIVMFGSLSFGLGRLSKTYENKPQVSIITPKNMVEKITVEKIALSGDKLVANPISATKNNIKEEESKEGIVVASKTGKKYHLPWCSGAKTISDNNKIWFNSIDEAKKAGYTPALNCKGLK